MKKIRITLLVFIISFVGSLGFTAVEPIEEEEWLYTEGVFDTFILRNRADYKKLLGEGVYGVPYNKLGHGEYTDTEILELINTRDPELIRDAIHTVYDAVQYFYLSGFQGLNSDYHDVTNGVGQWQIHKTGKEALLTNEGDCSGHASLMNYLIKDNYKEAGYFLLNQADGNGHVFNYVKQDDVYFFFDMTALPFATVERDRRTNSITTGYMGNMHQAESVDAYVKYYQSEINDRAIVFEMSKGDAVPAIAVDRDGERVVYSVDGRDGYRVVSDISDGLVKVKLVRSGVPSSKWIIPEQKVLQDRDQVGDFTLYCDVRLGEYLQSWRRNYDMYFRPSTDCWVKIEGIAIRYFDQDEVCIKEDVLTQRDLETHYPSTYIRMNENDQLRIGQWSVDPRARRAEIRVNAVDGNQHEIQKTYTLDLSQYSQGKPWGKVTPSRYDMGGIYANADFEIPIANGVRWVPANVLGKPNSSKKTLLSLWDPEKLRAEVDSLYEAMMFIKGTDQFVGTVNKRIMEGEINWEHHMPGYLAVNSEEQNCASLANLLHYLVEDDYDEVGYLMLSQKDGSGHVINYIYQDGAYYFIDMTHFLNGFQMPGKETGKIEDYDQSDFLSANVHRVSDPADYVNAMMTSYCEPPSLIAMYTANNCVPMESYSEKTGISMVVPESMKDAIRILHDPLGDRITYKFVPGPKEYPKEWSPYNTKMQ